MAPAPLALPPPEPDEPRDEVPHRVRGRVVDGDGKPVARLAVRLVPSRPRPHLALAELAAPATARAVTDSEGRFEFPAGAGIVVSEATDWWLSGRERRMEEHVDLLPPSLGGDVVVVAEPAVTLAASVLDAGTGAAVPKFRGWAQDPSRGSRYVSFTGEAGRLEIVWPPWWDLGAGATLDLTLTAEGYIPTRAAVRFPPGVRRAEAQVRMPGLPPEHRARLVLEVVDDAGAPFDADWWPRIVDPLHASRSWQDLGLAQRTGPGLYEVTAPPGRWTLLLKPNDWLGFLRWLGEVDLVAGGTHRVRCSMPPRGTLIIRWPARWSADREPVLAVSLEGEGSGVARLRGKTEFRSATCPEGEWEVTLVTPEGSSVSRRAIVRAREETLVEFEGE